MTRHPIARHMSAPPVVVDGRRTLAEAHELLRAHGIRHLPVIEQGRLIGVVSQRDLYLLETLRNVDPATERVAEAMTPDPFTVTPDAPLDEVAHEMAEHKYGCAVVVEGGAVVGVFTTVDALRVLSAVLRHGRGAGAARAGGAGVA